MVSGSAAAACLRVRGSILHDVFFFVYARFFLRLNKQLTSWFALNALKLDSNICIWAGMDGDMKNGMWKKECGMWNVKKSI